MQFLDVLDEFMRPGSYKFCYADTDSFMLALTRDTLDECVKPELAGRWRSEILPAWFVKSDKERYTREELLASAKEPGLLKVEAEIKSGWFIAPSPKCYMMVEKAPCELEAQICDPANEHAVVELVEKAKEYGGAGYSIAKKSSKGTSDRVQLR